MTPSALAAFPQHRGPPLCAVGGLGGGDCDNSVPEAQVPGPQVTLGDVAEIQGEPADTVARMRRVLLGRGPTSRGGTATLQEHACHPTQTPEAVDAGSPSSREHPIFCVRRASQRLDPQHLETAVRQALNRRLPQTTQPTSIRDIRGLSPVSVPLGPVQYGAHQCQGATCFTRPYLLYAHHSGCLGKSKNSSDGTATIAVVQEVVSLVRPVNTGRDHYG